MTDERQLETEIDMGRQAQELITNPAFIKAFDLMREERYQAWKASPVKDAEGREKLYLMDRLAEKFRLNLESMITTGKFAEREKLTLLERARNSYDAWKRGSD